MEPVLTIIITVECNQGEENVLVSSIQPDELDYITPLLLSIRDNNGYWPTGKQLVYPDPEPEMFYRLIPGVDILKGHLPEPAGGIKRISEINVFSETPKTLFM